MGVFGHSCWKPVDGKCLYPFWGSLWFSWPVYLFLCQYHTDKGNECAKYVWRQSETIKQRYIEAGSSQNETEMAKWAHGKKKKLLQIRHPQKNANQNNYKLSPCSMWDGYCENKSKSKNRNRVSGEEGVEKREALNTVGRTVNQHRHFQKQHGGSSKS